MEQAQGFFSSVTGRKPIVHSDMAGGHANSHKRVGKAAAKSLSLKKQVTPEKPPRQANSDRRTPRSAPAMSTLTRRFGTATASQINVKDLFADESPFSSVLSGPSSLEELDFQAVLTGQLDAAALEEELTKDKSAMPWLSPDRRASPPTPLGPLARMASPIASPELVPGDSTGSAESLGSDSCGFEGDWSGNSAAVAAASAILHHPQSPPCSSQSFAGSPHSPLSPTSSSASPKSRECQAWHSTFLRGQGHKRTAPAAVSTRYRQSSKHSNSTGSTCSGPASPEASLSRQVSPAKSSPSRRLMSPTEETRQSRASAESGEFDMPFGKAQSTMRTTRELDAELQEVLGAYAGIPLGSTEDGQDEVPLQDILTSAQAQKHDADAAEKKRLDVAEKKLHRLSTWAGGALQEEDRQNGNTEKDRKKASYADSMGSAMHRVRDKLAAVKNQFLMSSVAEDAQEHMAREALKAKMYQSNTVSRTSAKPLIS